jgi:predicted secreted protein
MSNEAIISARVGQPFQIELEANPTTGYQWFPILEPHVLELQDRTYEAVSTALGAGGTERVTLLGRKRGEFPVRFEYRRPWESEPIESRSFRVRVS